MYSAIITQVKTNESLKANDAATRVVTPPRSETHSTTTVTSCDVNPLSICIAEQTMYGNHS